MTRALLLIAFVLTACNERTNERANKAAPAMAPATSDALPKSVDLATELETLRAEHKLPAVAAAAWRDGKLLEIAAVGLRKADDATSKVTTKDLWHLASNTKAMTATLIGIYIDRGALRWNDTVAQLFRGQNIDPGYAKVTLDQLVRHEGGAPATPPDELWKQLWTDAGAPDARTKFVRALLAKPPAQPPGTFVYSNAGYMVAGHALEIAAGRRWDQLIRDELFTKLDMKSCGFGAPGSKAVPKLEPKIDQPWGHDAGGTPIAPGPAADNPPGLGPAGTVHCSLEDYGKFLSLHATGSPSIVTPETFQHLQTARSMGYAGGWMVVTSKRGPLLMHSGSNTMWYATAVVAPGEKLAFVIVTNSGSDALEKSLEKLLARYVPPAP